MAKFSFLSPRTWFASAGEAVGTALVPQPGTPEAEFALKANEMLVEIGRADPRRLFKGGFSQYNPNELIVRKGISVIDKMKRDEQVKAALAFKKHAVLASGWRIAVPEGMDEDSEPAVTGLETEKGLSPALAPETAATRMIIRNVHFHHVYDWVNRVDGVGVALLIDKIG